MPTRSIRCDTPPRQSQRLLNTAVNRAAALAFFSAAAICVAPRAGAAVINWANSAGQTNWSSGNSWIGGNPPTYDPNSNTGDTATFSSAGGINAQPVLSSDSYAFAVNFDTSGGNWTLNGAGQNLYLGNYSVYSSLPSDAYNLQVTGNGSLTVNSNVSENSINTLSVWNVAPSATLVVNGSINSNQLDINDGFQQSGSSGTVILNGANTFATQVELGNGTLILANDDAAGTPDPLNSQQLSAQPIYGTATIGLENNITVAQASQFFASYGNVIVQNISGNNAITGPTGGRGSITFLSSDTTGSLAIDGGITYDTSNSNLIFDGAGNTTVSDNPISNGFEYPGNASNVGVTKNGTGTLFLHVDSSFDGAVDINAGVLDVTSLADIGSSSSLGTGAGTPAITVGATLSYSGSADAETNRPILFSASGASLQNSSGHAVTYSGAMDLGGYEDIITGSSPTTLSGNITGVAGSLLHKEGSASLVLSGNNSWTGNLSIDSGTVQVQGGSAIPDTAVVAFANTAGATLDLNNSNETIGALSGGGSTGGNVTLGSGTLTLSTGTASYAGALSGNGGLTVSGATQTLTAPQKYSGATLITSGNLILSSSTLLGSGAVTVNGGALTASTLSNFNPAQTALVNLNGALIAAADFDAAPLLDPASTGLLALGVNNSHISGVNGSSVFLGSIGNYTLSSPSLSPGAGNAYRLGGGGGTLTVSAPLVGANDLIVGSLAAPGVVQITGPASFTGRLTVNTGSTLEYSSALGAPAPASNILNLGGTLQYAGSADSSVARNVTLAGPAGATTYPIGTTVYSPAGPAFDNESLSGAMNITGNVSGFGQTLYLLGSGNGSISGNIDSTVAAVVRAGAYDFSGNPFTWTLSGNNTFTGGLTLTYYSHTTNINSATALGSGTFTVDSGNQVGFNGNYSFANKLVLGNDIDFNLNGNTVAFNGSTTINQAVYSPIRINNGTLALNNIGDGGAAVTLEKAGAGELLLNGTGTYSGPTFLDDGIIKLGASGALGPGYIEFLAGSGQLPIIEGTAAVTSFTRALGSLNGRIYFGSTGGFAASGSDFTVNLGNNKSMVTWASGGFVPNNDALAFGAADADHTVIFQNPIKLNSSGNVTRTFDVVRGLSNVPDANIQGVISDSSTNAKGSINKTGNGILEFTGNNTYHGTTTIAAGTLLADNATSSTGTGAITVDNLATLGGSGVASGTISLLSGGIVSPGKFGPGALSTGAMTFSNGANTSQILLDLAGALAGTGYDQLNVAGALALGADTQLVPTLSFIPTLNELFDVINDTSVTGTFETLAQNATFKIPSAANGQNYTFQISYTGSASGGGSMTGGHDIVLENLGVVPEPSTLAGILFSAAVFLRRRR